MTERQRQKEDGDIDKDRRRGIFSVTNSDVLIAVRSGDVDVKEVYAGVLLLYVKVRITYLARRLYTITVCKGVSFFCRCTLLLVYNVN